MVGGKAAGRAAEGIIAKAVKDLFRVVAKDAEKDAARDALKATERDTAKALERDAAKTLERDATKDAEQTLEQDASRSLENKTLNGDPVDVATGAVVQHQTDVELPGVLALVLTRTHLSTYRHGRWFGPSWASTVDQRLEVSAAEVRFLAEDGAVLTYPRTGGEVAPLPRHGARWRLAGTADGYAVTEPTTGRTWQFTQRVTDTGVDWPLAAVADRNGHRVELDRDDAGNLTAIRHSAGYHLLVDTAGGRLVGLSIRDPATGAPVPLLRYGYDERGNLAEVVNSSGRPMRFEYDDDGRLTRWIDRNGSWYGYEYDGDGRCVRGHNPAGYLDRTFRYDREARTTTVVDSLGRATTFHLTPAGMVGTRTDPLGNTTSYEWDERDRLLSTTDPLGRTTTYRYDEAGNRVAATRPDGATATAAYNDLGLPVTVVGAGGATWQRGYDERGNLVAVTDPTGATARYARDEAGRLTAITDPLGTVRQVRTDPAGLVVAVTDQHGATTQARHDGFGRVVAVTDPLGNTTTLGWTLEGRLAWRARPDGATERWGYDPEGNLVAHVDAAGQLTRLEYGHFDVPTARTGPDGARTAFGYDSELFMTSVTDPRGLVWQYEYDAAGRLVRETDLNGRVLRYAHDAAGQLVEQVNGAGQATRYTLDALGNVLTQDCEGVLTTFEYDPAGWIVRAANADAEVTFERDAAGRVLAETCNGRTAASRYDSLGRRTHRRTPSGAETTWEFDGNSQPVALHAAGHSLRFGHDLAGREVARSIDGTALITQTWDASHRLATQTISRTGGQPRVLQHRAYHRRADGCLTGYDELLGGGRRFELDAAGRITAVDGPGWAERYAYDLAGNLTFADHRAQVPVGAETAGDREYAGTLVRRAGHLYYAHDAQGRVTARRQRTLSGQLREWRYSWDARDRLVAVATPDGRYWTYRYDPFGRRIAKQCVDSTGAVADLVEFAWDGNLLAEQFRAGRTTTWEYDPDGRKPLLQLDREAPQEPLDARFLAIVSDLLGTPTELVTSAGEVAWHRTATVWGTVPAGSDGCPLRFPGQYHDPETGLDYNHFRYYDPDTARYASPDPLGLNPAPNPFGYVPNPTAAADPLGLAPYQGEIPYKSNDLSQLAFQHRMTENLSSGRNVAVYEYVDNNGVTRHLIEANEPSRMVRGRLVEGRHSEEILNEQLRNKGINPESVTRVYSERVPCSQPGHDCAASLGGYRNASISWSFSGSRSEVSAEIYKFMTGS